MPMRSFFNYIFLVSIAFLAACSNQPAKQDTFGEMDTARIASDTTMQANMDLSYEYLKTLAQNDTLVYDFLAYDRPSYADPKQWEGKFIVIRRTNTKQDTIIKGSRLGAVKGLSLAYLDHKANPDFLFYEANLNAKYSWVMKIYTPLSDGKYKEIIWTDLDGKASSWHNSDTFFVYQDHLIRRFPYYEQNDSVPKGNVWQSYILKNDQMVLENEKRVE